MDNFSFLGWSLMCSFLPFMTLSVPRAMTMLLNIYDFLIIISIVRENHVLYFPNCKTHFFFVENVYKILHLLVHRCMYVTLKQLRFSYLLDG